MPVIKLFYEENNFNDTEYLTLFAIYSIVIAILEIPSGYLGDIWGRKKLLISGSIFGFIGFGIYSLTNTVTDSPTGTFLCFLSAEISLGIGLSFISGSDSAILYDTLLELKKENEYVKYEGKITAAGNFSEAIAGVIGPLLAIHSARIPYIFQTGVSAIGIIASFSLVETGMHQLQPLHKTGYIIKIVKYAMIENKVLQKFILFSSVIGFSSLIMSRLTLIYFSEIELDRRLYGILWPLLNLIVGIGSLLSFKIHKVCKDYVMTTMILLLMFLSYILLGVFISGFGFIF
jgi:MFS family permease